MNLYGILCCSGGKVKMDIDSTQVENKVQELPPLRQAQLVMLRMIILVDTVCAKYGIKYWLDGGTLLGAVRNKGFIPWDDDADIVMNRADYNKFIGVIGKELPKDIFVESDEINLHQKCSWLRLLYMKDFLWTDNWDGNKHIGLSIDVFPFDYVKDNKIQKNFFIGLNRMSLVRRPKQICGIKDVIKKIAYELKPIKFTRWFVNKTNKKVNNSNIKKYICVYGVETGFVSSQYMFRNETIFPLKKIEFENHDFFVPNDYDAYLRQMYGDYNILPEEKDRVAHSSTFEIIIQK